MWLKEKSSKKDCKKVYKYINKLFFTVSISFLSIKNLITTNMILLNDKIVAT